MEQNFTQEDLIRFIYQETSREENIKILSELELNFDLREEMASLLKTIEMLNELKYNPSETTMKILNEEAGSTSFEMS